MVIARMPEDCSKTSKTIQTPYKTIKPLVHLCVCAPVGRTDDCKPRTFRDPLVLPCTGQPARSAFGNL
eukprot:1075039-Heterocapsa_arctica.AAC.1